MKSLFDYIKKYSEVLIFTVLTLLLILTFFVKEISILLFLFTLCLVLFLKTETILYILVFLFPLQVVYSYPFADLFNALYIIEVIGITKNFILDLIKKTKKFSWKLYLPFVALLIYMIIVPKVKTWSLYIYFIANMLTAFYALEYRKDIKFSKIIEYLSLSLIISGVMWIFRDYCSILKQYEYYDYGVLKFSGAFIHPNIFGFYDVLAVAGLLYCFYSKSMPEHKFLLYFIGCFIFGYMTLSRNVLLNFAVSLIIFAILLIKRDGLKSLKFLFSFVSIILLLCLIMSDVTAKNMGKINDFYDADYEEVDNQLKDEYWDLIYEGKFKYDPGRIGLWRIYILYLLRNPKFLIFGRGYGAVKIGQTSPHNLILVHIYYCGIIGLALYILMLLAIFGWKKIFCFTKHQELLMILIPFAIYLMLNPLTYDMMFIPALIMAKYQNGEAIVEDQTEKMYEMIENNKRYNKILN